VQTIHKQALVAFLSMLAYLDKQASISAQLLASPFAPKGQTSISKR
jgi:hypothetical protein